MDPFRQMRHAHAGAHPAMAATGVIAKAARARQVRWERENRMTRLEQESRSDPDQPQAGTFTEWLGFALFVGVFLALVVGAMAMHL